MEGNYTVYGKCTIYFEDPFWVGIFERKDEAGYAIARHVFGAEPSDAELYQFILEGYRCLAYSPPGQAPENNPKEVNFKRRQREARRSTQEKGVGTWAQRALQAERERQKEERQAEQRLDEQELARQKFLVRQERKKQKHRGH